MIQSVQIVRCDTLGCNPATDGAITGLAVFTMATPLGEVYRALVEDGWEVISPDSRALYKVKHYCPKCKGKSHEPPKRPIQP